MRDAPPRACTGWRRLTDVARHASAYPRHATATRSKQLASNTCRRGGGRSRLCAARLASHPVVGAARRPPRRDVAKWILAGAAACRLRPLELYRIGGARRQSPAADAAVLLVLLFLVPEHSAADRHVVFVAIVGVLDDAVAIQAAPAVFHDPAGAATFQAHHLRRHRLGIAVSLGAGHDVMEGIGAPPSARRLGAVAAAGG